jgi:peptide/nickel transport system permease protein
VGPVTTSLEDSAPDDGRFAADSTTWGKFSGLRSGKFVAGLVIVGFFVVVAIVGPVVVRTSPSAEFAAVLQPPSGSHWLGTTQQGQDIFAEMVYGTRISVLVGFVAAAVATFLGVVIGVTSGFLGGLYDEFLSVIMNVFLVIPALPLVIVLAGYLPSRGWFPIAIVIAVTGWAFGARVLRAQTLSLAKRDFIQATRATGESTVRIVFSEILPNLVPIVAAGFLTTVIFAIITQASLAFLGLATVSQWSWGSILYWAQTNGAFEEGAWWWYVPPGLAIALLGTGLTLLNFGIDEFVNPRLRTGGIRTREPSAKRRKGVRQPSGSTLAYSPQQGGSTMATGTEVGQGAGAGPSERGGSGDGGGQQ